VCSSVQTTRRLLFRVWCFIFLVGSFPWMNQERSFPGNDFIHQMFYFPNKTRGRRFHVFFWRCFKI
jgi:hypothetical protein